MSIVYVPFHLDEPLPDLNVPIPEGFEVTEVSPELSPEDDVWARLCALYEAVAGAVESEVRTGSPVPIVSGDCTLTIGIAAGLQRAGLDPAIV